MCDNCDKHCAIICMLIALGLVITIIASGSCFETEGGRCLKDDHQSRTILWISIFILLCMCGGAIAFCSPGNTGGEGWTHVPGA